MAEYELVHEIQNLCRNNQMRDVFIEEVACDDPVAYVQALEPDIQVEVTRSEDGKLVVLAEKDQYRAKYSFTEI